MPVDARADPPPKARRDAALSHVAAALGLVVPFGTVLGPLVAWVVFRDEHPFVDGQARHAVDLNLAFLAVELGLVAVGLSAVFLAGSARLGSLVTVLFALLGLTHAGVVIYAAVRAKDGVDVHVPFRVPVLGR